MSGDSNISKIVSFSKTDAHRIGLPVRHRDTSSKQAPEAIIMEGSYEGSKITCRSSDVRGKQLWKE